MTTRPTVLGVLACLVLATITLTGPAANAAWDSPVRIHGAKLQVCQVPLSDGRARVKVRLDNRRASHRHLGTVSRVHRGAETGSVTVRAAAGRLSSVKSLVLSRGDELSAGMGDRPGEGAGGGWPLSQTPRC